MPKKREIPKLKTSLFSRGLSLAALTVQAGARAAAQALSATDENSRLQYLLKQAGALTSELGELKGSLMKAGQMLSVFGEHFFPPEVNQILKRLQFESPPVAWKEMQKILVKQLGKEKLAKLEVETEPLAAASLGQVHRAREKGMKRELVLKIQYPGLEKVVDSDVSALKSLLKLSKLVPQLPALDPVFEEVRAMLHKELDYERERKNLEKFGSLLKADTRYLLPAPHADYCTKRVLTMDYLPGEQVDGEAVRALSQARRDAIGTAALELYLRELFEFHAVQTDPHFGNYRVRIGNKAGEDKLVLYDFGAVRELEKKFVADYRNMLAGVVLDDRSRFEQAAMALGVIQANDTGKLKDCFYELCRLIVEPFAAPGFEWGNNDLPKRVALASGRLLRDFPLRTPPREIIFLDRKMTGMYTFLSVLKVRFDASAVLRPFLQI